MPRSRSRSPKRPERRRSRSRSRERRRRPRRSRSRSPPPRYRSRSPARRRSRSHSRSPRRRSPSPRRRSKEREGERRNSQSEKKPAVIEKPKIDETQLAGLSEEDREMMSLMGFANFDTTKGKKVEGNDIYATNISRKRRYRQYMNRRGGFNRPLDFIA